MKKALLPAIATFCALCAPGIFAATASAQDAPVHVQFVDDSTKTIFATSDIPPDKLPAGFSVNAVLNINGQKWAVVSANPAAKTDFLKAGNLTLILTRVDQPAPAPAAGPAPAPPSAPGLLFDVPSVSGGIPDATGTNAPGDNTLLIRKNDWRQLEFVSTNYEKEIATEFADIHAIRLSAVQGPGGGFRELNVRQDIAAPLKDLVPREVSFLLPQLKQFTSLAFQKQRGTVPHGFAWAIDHGLMLWGTTDDDGNITTLGLAGTPEKANIPAISEALSKLTMKYDLYLVDWCREVKIHGDAQDFEKYFGGN